MKTIYLSDMDGTLLTRDAMLSSRSREILSALIEKGVLFSIATARAMQSALPILDGLPVPIPLVMMNGAILYDMREKRVLHLDTFERSQVELALELVQSGGFEPLLYTFDENDRQRIYYTDIMDGPQQAHVASRLAVGDPRFRKVDDFAPCLGERAFYVTTIGPETELRPLSERLSQAGISHHFYYDVYTRGHFIECCPRSVDKGSGAQRLKEMLGADRLVAFGDNYNDLPLFRGADESYAVADAQQAAKDAADGVIGNSFEDGVALFLAERYI